MMARLGLIWSQVRGSRATLYRGGAILTMDSGNRVVEALAVEGERIVAAGSEVELRAWAAARGARMVDLGGRALLPGFVDAHSHFPGAGVYAVAADLNSPPIGSVETVAEVVSRMQARAAAVSAGRWVVGIGYDDTLLAERRHPTREDLDSVSTTNPVAVIHVSGHLAAVNGVGLTRLGIRRETPDPVGGRIRHHPTTGEPDGVLEESAMMPVLSVLQRPSLLDTVRILRRATFLYLQAGVTTAQNGYTSPREMRAVPWLVRLRLLPLRLVLWPGQEATEALLDGTFAFGSPAPAWLRRGASKLIADGSIQGYTAYLSRPYHVPPAADPDYRGYPRITRDELFRQVARYHALGLQVAIHGNGDATIEDILDAIETAQHAHPRADARHVVVHAQMAREDQLDRMHELGVIPSFFSLHTYYWGDRHREIFLGPERTARISPAASAAARGIRFTLHCDTPVVPMEPLRLVWAAVNRCSSGGKTVGEAERINAQQALRAVTIDAAWQHFEEHDKGSLEPGKLADLVILDHSPLDDPTRIDQIRVLETIVAGRTRYKRS